MQTEAVPDFIEPKTIVDMTDEEYGSILDGIRERRMILVALHTQAVTLKNKAKSDKLVAKINKLTVRIEKEISKVEKIGEAIQLFVSQIRGLKIEAMELEDIDA